ncbi:MAG: trypsin-like peptidase domain-containing protein, partial [Paludibacter sp.]
IEKNQEIRIQKGDEVIMGRLAKLDWSKILVPVISNATDVEKATVMGNDETETFSIGTSSDNKIVLNDPSAHISRHHATLKHKHDGHYYVYDQSTNGTYVNGVKIKTKVDFPVSTTDTISFAQLRNLDWSKVTKIPNAKVPPFVPPVKAPESKPQPSTQSSNGWSILFYIVAAVVGIGWYFYSHKQDTPTTQTEVVQPTTVAATVIEPTAPVLTSSNSDLTSLYESHKSAVIMIYTSDGTNGAQGSGFFIASSGIAVSNYHVFKGSSQGLETIKTTNGNTYKVESVLAKSEESDYIVFKVVGQGASFPYLKIASTLPRVGENVFAIGAPEGLELTLSTGIVSALRGNNALIQTTTEITYGSSGGPLFNMSGQVIGITSAGMGEANLNFAVSVVGLGLERY